MLKRWVNTSNSKLPKSSEQGHEWLRRTHMDLAELEPHDHISALFDNAKEVDEFEYCFTLLRIRGIEDHGWDPLRESESNYE